ncbi:MAG: hypothetical protein PHH57_05100 [Candidatus Omnitrophica bacterium]|nr:hypothetical protein [Candidatus Omnitrophota bacterium]
MKNTVILAIILTTMVIAAGCAPEAPAASPPPDPIISLPTTALSPAATTAPGTTAVAESPVVAPVPIAPPGTTLDPMPGRTNVYSVEIDLVPSKLVYLPGEQIDMKLVLTNASTGDVESVIIISLPPVVNLVRTGSFSGPVRPPGIVIPPSEAGQSGAVKTYSAGTGEKTLAKGEELTYDLTWDQKDKGGNQVSPGWYNYESTCYYRPESSENNVGSGVGKRAFLIQYPQGAMQKTIEVNQSKTITGLPITTLNGETKLVDVTITLERVELNEMGATFYATLTSPNNPVTGYDNPEWMGHVPMSAQFVVDGTVKEVRAPNSQFLDDGIEFRWGASADDLNYLDPVPADAKGLTFVIPEIRPDWTGPWEFKIQLE